MIDESKSKPLVIEEMRRANKYGMYVKARNQQTEEEETLYLDRDELRKLLIEFIEGF